MSFALAPTEKAEHVLQLLQDTDAFLESESLPSIANLFAHGEAQLHMDGGPALLKGARDHLGEDKNFRRSLEHVKRNIAKEKDKLHKWNFVKSVRTWLDFSARISSDLLFHMYWVEIFKILTKHNEETFCSYLQNEHFTLSSGFWDATWRGKGYSLNALDSFWSVIDQMGAEEGKEKLCDLFKIYEPLVQ